MSIQVFAWVIDRAPADLSTGEYVVALMLANHASHETGLAYPSVKRLASESRMSSRGVQYALKTLLDRGVIAVEIPATNKRPTVYRFPAFRGATFAPQENARGANDDSLGVQMTTHFETDTSKEPSIEPSVATASAVAANKPPKRAVQIGDWRPPAKAIEWAKSEGFSEAELTREVPKFTDHFRANGKPMKDWPAAFRNWMRRSREMATAASNGHGPIDDEAMAAWVKVTREAIEEGSAFADHKMPKPIFAAVTAIGGMKAVDATNSFQRRDFLAAYRAARGHAG